MGLYATRPSRVFLSMISVYLLFSGVFMLFISVGFGNIIPSSIHPDTLSVLERSLYHSAITFFTIGYGDFYPSGPLRIVCGVEGFVGVFLMAYFTVAFVRKILRWPVIKTKITSTIQKWVNSSHFMHSHSSFFATSCGNYCIASQHLPYEPEQCNGCS